MSLRRKSVRNAGSGRACGAKASEMQGRDEPAAQKRPKCRIETSLRRQKRPKCRIETSLRRRKRPGLHDRDSHDRDGAGAGARAGSARSAAEVCGGPGDVRQRPRVQLLELLRASLNAEFWLTDEEANSAAVRQRFCCSRLFATGRSPLSSRASATELTRRKPPPVRTQRRLAPQMARVAVSSREWASARPDGHRDDAVGGAPRRAHSSKEPRTLYTATGACACTRSSRASAGPRRSAGLGSGSLSVEP